MTRQDSGALAAYTAPIYEQVTGWRLDDPGRGVMLEGSLAEGFGNSSSDLDFLVVLPAGASPPLMPSLAFSGGRRVEVRQRDVEQLVEQFRRLGAGRRIGGEPGIEDRLDRCQRFLGGLTLSDPTYAIQKVRESIDADQFADLVSTYCAARARRSLHLACAARLLDDGPAARDWAQSCLHYVAKTWLATRGETYIGRKWLQHQLDRAGAGEIRERFTGLAALIVGGELPDVLANVHEFGRDLGVLTTRDLDLRRLRLCRIRHVTTWDIGSRTHIIQRRARVFVLNAAGARVWRGLAFGRPLAASLASAATSPANAVPAFLYFLWRSGLVRLSWQGGEDLAGKLDCGADTHVDQPVVTLRGGRANDACAQPQAQCLPIGASEFATAGMSLVWANIMIENAREDLEGALDADQIAVASWAIRRIVRDLGLAVLSAEGIIPLPPWEEAASYVIRSPGTPAQVREIMRRLVGIGQPENTTQARHTFGLVKELVDSAREAMGFQEFPRSFETSATWHTTTDIGYDWVRIGAYLDSDFPIEEAHDLLSRQGAEGSVRGGQSVVPGSPDRSGPHG